MKRTFLFVTLALLLVTALWQAYFAKPTHAQAASSGVVIFFCTLSGSGATETTSVFESDSSAGAPTVPLGEKCSVALESLISQGYSIAEFSANPPNWAGEYVLKN